MNKAQIKDYNEGFNAGYKQAKDELRVEQLAIERAAFKDTLERLWGCVGYLMDELEFEDIQSLGLEMEDGKWWKAKPEEFLNKVENHKRCIPNTRWIRTEKDEWYGEQGICPVCAHVTIDLKNYCPNCGEKLRTGGY